MSDKDINQMDFKELRKEVQSLRDELAIMQRKYEDILYNLDSENFSSQFINGINSKVSSDEVESMISQTADKISSRIEDVEDAYSHIEQEVDNISSKVSDENGVYSLFEQTAYGFTLDGEKVTFTGCIYLTDNSNNKAFSIFHQDSSDNGNPAVFLWNYLVDGGLDIIIGDSTDRVYLKSNLDENYRVATQGWVKNNNTAKFG